MNMNITLVTVADPDFKRDLDKFLEGTTGVVEANSFEVQALWETYTKYGRKWDSEAMGLICGVGTLADMPVTLQLRTATVDGQKIVFYDSPSQVVDHRMIEKWLDENVPASAKRENGRVNRADASNFHNVLR